MTAPNPPAGETRRPVADGQVMTPPDAATARETRGRTMSSDRETSEAQPRCDRCRRFVKAGVQHCDDCAVRLYAFFVPNEMHWREVYLERERAVPIDETGYGFPSCVRDPRDFLPDLECSSEQERLRWVEACQIAAAFGDPDLSGNQHINANGFHMSRTMWGLGSYIWRETEAPQRGLAGVLETNRCIGCYQPPDAPCNECGRPFDSWAMRYTTTVCAVCGDVYQIEYRVCEQCDRRLRTDLTGDAS